jgi:para-nitrobenzyl esterase
MKTILATILLVLVRGSAWADSGPVVKVTGGQIRGTPLNKGGAVFKGIPYAQPPVGDLRWREPMPVKPWTGVRDATAFGAICPQAAGFNSQGAIVNEDCLYTNVWAPEWPSRSRKAVMVWIPSGGNIFGGVAAGNPENDGNDGESLARHGVVVVSLNYRLGSFGFFSHPALTRESPHHASGNQGILDQIAALKWVRDNIANFGGDPRNVTISGCSAGSIDASVLMATPLSKGLFERVIAESGSVVIGQDGFQALGEAEKSGEKLAAGWNVPPGASLKVLRAISAADILKSGPDPGSAMRDPLGRVHIPQALVDGYVFMESPIKLSCKAKNTTLRCSTGATRVTELSWHKA